MQLWLWEKILMRLWLLPYRIATLKKYFYLSTYMEDSKFGAIGVRAILHYSSDSAKKMQLRDTFLLVGDKKNWFSREWSFGE
jgi:hypothetical protein